MGEIKKYDESMNLFGEGRGKVLSAESAAVRSLQVGEFWQEDHDCGTSGALCSLQAKINSAAKTEFGTGNYSTSHTNGIIAVLRKA